MLKEAGNLTKEFGKEILQDKGKAMLGDRRSGTLSSNIEVIANHVSTPIFQELNRMPLNQEMGGMFGTEI